MNHKKLHIVAKTEDNTKSYEADATRAEIERWFSRLDDPRSWWISVRDEGGREVAGKTSGFAEINWQRDPVG